VVEVCNAAILIAFLFSMRRRFEKVSYRIRHGGHALTAADFTVMVSNVPERWRSDQLRVHFEQFGSVVHIGASLDYRELILSMQEAQRLKDRYVDATLYLIGLIRGGAKPVKIEKARRRRRRCRCRRRPAHAATTLASPTNVSRLPTHYAATQATAPPAT